MVEAKEGKIDVDYFKNVIPKKEVIETEYGPSIISKYEVKFDYIARWFLNFFTYLKEKIIMEMFIYLKKIL